MKLSYIVPAYNVEQYLQRCIDSIYNQGLEADDFEVIIVDDGSADNTYALATKLSEDSKYKNLRVLTQENQGSSVACNNGIRHALGEYIWRVDSDDWVKEGMMSQIMDKISEAKPDMYFIELLRHYPNEEDMHRECVQQIEKNVLMSGEQAILSDYYPCSSCSAIIKREFIAENKLEFYPKIYHQDVEFMYRAVAKAESVIFSEFAPYVYETNPNSVTTSMTESKKKKRLVDDLIVADSFKRFSTTLPSVALRERICQQSRSIAMGAIWNLVKDKNSTEAIRTAVMDKCRELGMYPLVAPTKSLKQRLLVCYLNIKTRG